jgi:hypothetical protein
MPSIPYRGIGQPRFHNFEAAVVWCPRQGLTVNRDLMKVSLGRQPFSEFRPKIFWDQNKTKAHRAIQQDRL